jgi:hypothetical protein
MSAKLAGLLIQLEAWAHEELAAQRELARLLEEQQGAVARNDGGALAASDGRIRDRLRSSAARDRRRTQLLERLASELGVARGTLTLGSLVARAESLGLPVAGLRGLRGELREACARVLRLGRRLAAVARSHRALLDEVLRSLAPGDAPGETADTGSARDGRPVLFDVRG